MLASAQQEIKELALREVYSNEYFRVYTDPAKKTLVCQTQSTYIPFEIFQSSFQQCAGIIGAEGIERFVFDKRSLRAFHQPSMEWYFVVWKQELYRKWGMRQHRKILPAEPWFCKCVEAGRHEIEQKFPQNLFQELDISYTSNLKEALEF